MSELWLDRAKRFAEQAVAAENDGDTTLVEYLDDQYMRCLFNYYDENAQAEACPPQATHEKDSVQS